MTVLPVILPVVVGVLAFALALAAWRLFRGPSAPDRVLALDTLYITALALLVALGIWFDTTLYFEVALLIGLLGFVGTVVVATYLLRGRIVP
ncbi:MAG: K+/H+ antiporter subunit F [Aquincola sp.]|nr:K+/H+ antiporter subunit F [Aquincola sp.]MDH4288535.1 K+/H+ antiporter subunit F [Aquincola sp.]MDH5329781.1 K+/H+ antiporter subunit F [Aquincola sp.]